MRRIALTIVFALVWGALISTPALAAGTTMIETRVLTVEGKELGTIKRVALSEDGCIKYVVLSSRGRLIPIPWRVVTVSPERHAVVVRIDRTIIEKAPVIRGGQWAQINEQQINQFYESHLSRGKERLEGRTEEGASKSRRQSEKGARSSREPATTKQDLKGRAGEQAQPPSSRRESEMAKPGAAKESIKKGREQQGPPPNVPGAVQQQKSGEAKPGSMMKQDKPGSMMKQDRPGEQSGRGSATKERRPAGPEKPDSKKADE